MRFSPLWLNLRHVLLLPIPLPYLWSVPSPDAIIWFITSFILHTAGIVTCNSSYEGESIPVLFENPVRSCTHTQIGLNLVTWSYLSEGWLEKKLFWKVTCSSRNLEWRFFYKEEWENRYLEILAISDISGYITWYFTYHINKCCYFSPRYLPSTLIFVLITTQCFLPASTWLNIAI